MGGKPDAILDVETVEASDDSPDSTFDWVPPSVEREDGGATDIGNAGERARELGERKQEINRQQDIKKARAKAKQRRFAARAAGVTTVHDMPWAIEWKFSKNGTFRMKLVCPDEQTEARLDKINQSNVKALEQAELWRNNVSQSSHQPVDDGSSPRHEPDVHR